MREDSRSSSFIVEGKLRFPLHPFFHEVYSRCRLNPMQLCSNFVRVIMGVLALNQLLNLELNWWDIHYLYSVVTTNDNSYYFKARNNDHKLITDLPNSLKGECDDCLVVTENGEPKDTEGNTIGFPCPTTVGRLCQYLFLCFTLVSCYSFGFLIVDSCFLPFCFL